MGKKIKSISLQEMKRIKAKSLLKGKVPIQKIPQEVGTCRKTIDRLRNNRPQRKKGSGSKKILSRS